jgi:CheY-like chemotaxis protein
VTATVDAQSLNIAVRDSGIGLSSTAIVKVFDMFSQVESAVDRSQGGLGIGLALVKGLVALHGGVVDADSAGVGKGSTFVIRLPLSVISSLQPQAPARPKEKPANPRRRKVLVVDDNRDGARSLALVLEMGGHDVSVAYSGLSALELGEATHPDVCIIDIGMPDLNGYETARRMRGKEWGKRALLLALTGWGQQDDKARAREAGFDRHFTKPVDPSELEQALDAFSKQLTGGDVVEDQ